MAPCVSDGVQTQSVGVAKHFQMMSSSGPQEPGPNGPERSPGRDSGQRRRLPHPAGASTKASRDKDGDGKQALPAGPVESRMCELTTNPRELRRTALSRGSPKPPSGPDTEETVTSCLEKLHISWTSDSRLADRKQQPQARRTPLVHQHSRKHRQHLD